MTTAPRPYRCTVCDAAWSYEAVKYVARCPACGGTLLRREEAPATRVLAAGEGPGRSKMPEPIRYR
jgi:hypothetical protein